MKILLYDPTKKDTLSGVRGIGRYVSSIINTYIYSKNNQGNFENASYLLKNLEVEKIFELKKLNKSDVLLNPFFNMLNWPLIFSKKTKKQIVVIHDLIPLKYKKHYKLGIKGAIKLFFNKLSLRFYDAIITDSIQSKNDIIKIFKIKPEKINVIYPFASPIFLPHIDLKEETPVHHHPFKHSNSASEAEFTSISTSKISANSLIQSIKDYIIYVGDCTYNKNLQNLARAIKMSGVTCIFVGKVFDKGNINNLPKKPHPWQKSFYEFLQIAKDHPSFVFASYVTDIELIELYKKARLNILPSFDEGFGYSYLEAAYCQTPSILSNIEVFKEISRDTALYVNPNDPKDIADKITKLFYDRLLREKLSIESFNRAQDFSGFSYLSNLNFLVKNI